jgi:hypothetical protein
MKIAFLSPWKEAAEDQAARSLAIAARSLGHELFICKNSSDIEDCAPDFVLGSSISTQPKMNDIPHYGIVCDPLVRLLSRPDALEKIMTYDSYLTVASTLERFLKNLDYGIGCDKPIGFYYNTCQRGPTTADLSRLIRDRALRITYVGINWDKRRPAFFRSLSEIEDVEIYGPPNAWNGIDKKSYHGLIAFDGVSIQNKYASNGIGLCMMSQPHLESDIVTNRIFETTSVGAVAFCPEMPWIRKYFGNSVYYFDQSLSDTALLKSILDLRDLVYEQPEIAIEKAKQAKLIFEKQFSAEVMIENVVNHHQFVLTQLSESRIKAEQSYCPLVSVIIRCSGGEVEQLVNRAIKSISQQSYGQFEVILVGENHSKFRSLVGTYLPRITSINVIDSADQKGSRSLWDGLRVARGEYFAVLDNSNWWFSNHFERLFQPAPTKRLQNFFAYSGSLIIHQDASGIEGGGQDNRELYSFAMNSFQMWRDAFAPNCFVASIDLLDRDLLVDPALHDFEESYLALSLSSRTEAKFSHAMTNVIDRSVPQLPNAVRRKEVHEDLFTLQLRLSRTLKSKYFSGDFNHSTIDLLKEPVLPDNRNDAEPVLSYWDQVSKGFDAMRSVARGHSRFLNPSEGSAIVEPPFKPWNYGVQLYVNRPKKVRKYYALIIEIVVREGGMGIGMLDPDGGGFAFRRFLVPNKHVQKIRIPIIDFRNVGRLVIQNGTSHGQSVAEIVSIKLFEKPENLIGSEGTVNRSLVPARLMGLIKG